MLIEQGVLEEPPLFQIVTGIRYGFPGTVETLVYAKSLLPQNAHWAAFGIGRMMFPMVAAAFTLGAHVRCGFEDAVQIRKGQLAASNAEMVAKAARIVDDLGGELATPDEARAILVSRSERAHLAQWPLRPCGGRLRGHRRSDG